MFHHVMLYRLRPGIPLERIRGAREALAALVESLPGVVQFTVTHNTASDNGGYTLALFSTFESSQAYEIFTRHPEYLRVWEQELRPVIEHYLVAQGQGEPNQG